MGSFGIFRWSNPTQPNLGSISQRQPIAIYITLSKTYTARTFSLTIRRHLMNRMRIVPFPRNAMGLAKNESVGLRFNPALEDRRMDESGIPNRSLSYDFLCSSHLSQSSVSFVSILLARLPLCPCPFLSFLLLILGSNSIQFTFHTDTI